MLLNESKRLLNKACRGHIAPFSLVYSTISSCIKHHFLLYIAPFPLYGAKLKNGLVVKDNALMNASYNLETSEQRLILLAIMNARETGQGITADSKLEIHASDYAKHFNVSTDAAYKVLKDAVNNLFERKFSYVAEYKKTGKTGIVRSRWVSRVFYVDTLAILEITFAPDVVPLVTRLEEHFTSYQLKQVSQLTGKYAIRLYENSEIELVLRIMNINVWSCLKGVS